MKTAFIGHRKILAGDIDERLTQAIKAAIGGGCKFFTIGTHGEFDNRALQICKNLRQIYSDIEIEVVLTNPHAATKGEKYDYSRYADVKTVIYDINATHYKRQITLSNRQMIDNCDTLICYVDKSACNSGAKTALLYAEKCGKKIINLFRETDKPFYGMTKEEADRYMKQVIEDITKSGTTITLF